MRTVLGRRVLGRRVLGITIAERTREYWGESTREGSNREESTKGRELLGSTREY